MARVPTWAELRIDVTKLIQMQKECYRDVHDMLDRAIPEFDSKMSFLRYNGPRNITKSTSTKFTTKPTHLPSSNTYSNISSSFRQHAPSLTMNDSGDLPHFYEQIGEPSLQETVPKVPHKIVQKPVKIIQKPVINKKSSAQSNGYHKLEVQRPIESLEANLDELEHLRPLPRPLSYYLKKNRPELVREADRRAMYLKKKAEKRRQLATTRTINALDLIRSSSRSSSNRGAPSLRSSIRTISRENVAPHYQVRCKLSEQEMKRLTARTYNRLPEVKKQRNEQVTKHMKVQNYKNKMDYGRQLLENRRQGIINYPLRTNYDDSSVMSSQEESFTNSLDQSADALKFDQYY